MANCSVTLNGLAYDCAGSVGGIRKVYIAEYAENIFSAQSAGSVTTLATGVSWYEYNFRRNTGSMNSTLNVDPTVGSNYVSTELVMQFGKMDTAKRIEMAALSTGNLVALVVDCNGKAWCLGVNEPLVASAGAGQTGTNKTDGNYYQITLTDEANTYPLEYTGTLPTPAA